MSATSKLNGCEQNYMKHSSTPNKGIVLGCARYNGMLSKLCQDEDEAKEQQKEDQYEKYLRDGSRAMVAKWEDNMEKAHEMKELERKRAIDQRHEADKQEFLKIKENDEKIRREKIEKAQQLVLKTKSGPKELESAAILSEVLKGRNIQRNINAEFEQAMTKRAEEDKKKHLQQALPWIAEDQKRMYESKKRHNQYKSELYNSIKENQRNRSERHRRNLKNERSEWEQKDQDQQEQILREKELQMKKREAMRQNALEAMKMVEQRRLRDRKQDEIDNKLNRIYIDGKEEIAKIRREKEHKAFDDKVERCDANAKYLKSIQPDIQGPEQERYAKDVAEINQNYFTREQEKIQKNKAMKEAKIREYLEEQNRQKEAQKQKAEEFRFAVANRLKNEKVNDAFGKAQMQEKLNKFKENRTVLVQQIVEKQTTENQECEIDKKCSEVSFQKEDSFFFNYADNLMNDAKNKSRPIYPFIKAVQKYKKDNLLDMKKPIPSHLKSHIEIGVAPATPCPASSALPISPGRRYAIAELKKLNSPPKCCS